MRQAVRVVALVAAIFVASSPISAKDNWNKVQSKNFTLVGDVSDGDLRKIAFKLEQFRETISLILPKAKIKTATPTTVILFKSDYSFRPFKPRYEGKIKENVGGYFLSRPHMNYIVLSIDKESVNPYHVIFHEYEHFLLHNNLATLPVWLDEGLAEFYSTFESDDELKVRLGLPVPQHIFYLRDHTLLPLKTLLAVDRKSPHYNETRKAGMFYAESWALVHYLMNGNAQKRQPQLIRFIDLISAGSSIEESFQQAFQTDFKAMEQELNSYVRKFAFPVLSVTFRDPVVVPKDMKSVVLSEAESQYQQGDLLMNMRQFSEAKSRLEKSIALDPKLASSKLSLGMLYMFNKEEAEAEKMFQMAVDTDPQNYLAHYYKGELLLANRQYEDAIRSYKQAIELNADLAVLYSNLGFAYLRINNEDEAIRTFERGKVANPRESYLYRTLAYIYFRRRNGERAAGEAYNYLRLKGWRDQHSQYAVLLWYFGLKMMKKDAFALESLQTSILKVDQNDWPFPVFKYLNGQLTLTDLISQAKDVDQQTEAHAYAGLELSFKGEREAALEHLRWVKEKGNRNFVEYNMALSELALLEPQSP